MASKRRDREPMGLMPIRFAAVLPGDTDGERVICPNSPRKVVLAGRASIRLGSVL